jgi:predicted murein hydrolase (TIGR00659 family)
VSAFLSSPLFCVTFTIGVYLAAERLQARFRTALLHPVLVSIVVIAPLLRVLRLDYAHYAEGSRFLTFLLGPAVVALGLNLHLQSGEIRRHAKSLVISLGIGATVGIVSAVLITRALGGTHSVVASLAPKSVTTPIAMGIAERLGGIPSLTAVLVILVGVYGAVIGPGLLKLLRIRSRMAWGLGMGASAHAVGTARAVEEGDIEGAAGALAIGVMGLFTALLAPLLLVLLG